MYDQDVSGNVVLTADNSQYDRSMQQSASTTDQLASSVDTLGKKIDNLAKSAGRKLIGFTAADLGVITAATVAYGAWEKQMTALNSQAAILSSTVAQQRTTFRQYGAEVDSLRRTFGSTTGEAASLVQAISKLSDSTAPAKALAESFSKLGQAVQESPTALASGMLQLQRTMGTTQRDTATFNNQLAVLASRSNASAQGILEFANSIAPVGRLVNMSQTDIMGFSNAFIRAGQDGYQAANVFNRMLSDIAYATQTGSPELAKYANLVGMTVGQFKELSGTDKYLKIFDAINRQGPQAITTLNRMGLDGMRTVRTVTAMAQQGGMAQEIMAARNADPNAMERGAKTAMTGLFDSFKRFRAELAETGEAFGKNFAGPARVFIDTLTKITSVARYLAEGPLGKLAAGLAMVAAPLAAIAGTGLLASKALLAFSAARAVLTGSFASGFREGGVGPQADNIAARGSWSNRMFYGAGAGASRGLGMLTGGRAGSMTTGLSRLAGYGLTGMAWGANNLITPQYSAATMRGYNDVTRRWRTFNAPSFRESMGLASGGYWSQVIPGRIAAQMEREGTGFRTRSGAPMAYEDAYRTNQEFDRLGKSRLAGISGTGERLARAEENVRSFSQTARASQALGKAAMTAEAGLSRFGKSMGMLMMTIGSAGMGAGRFAGSLASSAYSLVGGNPILATGLGLVGGYAAYKGMTGQQGYTATDQTSFNAPYFQAAGISAPRTPMSTLMAPSTAKNLTFADAYNISPSDVSNARSGGYKYTNDAVKSAGSITEARTALAAQWSTLSKSPQAINAVAMDLTAKFGPAAARETLATLTGTSNLDISGLAKEAAKPGKKGFWDHMLFRQSSDLTEKKLDTLFGAVDNRGAYIGQTQGEQARLQYLNQSMDQIYKSFVSGDTSYETSGAFRQAMAQRYLGVSLSNRQAYLETGMGKQQTMDEFVATLIKGQTDKNGFTVGKLTDDQRRQVLGDLNLDTSLTGDEAVAAINKALDEQSKLQKENVDSAAKAIEAASAKLFGAGGVLGIQSVKTALTTGAEDPNAQYQAVSDIVRGVSGQGGTGKQITFLLNQIATANGDAQLGSDLFQQALGMIQRQAAFRAPYQTRTQNFRQATNQYSGVMNAAIGPGFMQVRDQAQDTYYQQVQGQYDYFKNLLYQQREYDISRTRAEEDFDRMRSYAQIDFALSRARAEQDYQISRARSEADFERNRERTVADFQLSRRRQEEDYQHSVMLMVQQQAQQMYNIYERVNVQRTSSAGYLLYNSNDQLQRMQQQSSNLDKLREEGLSDKAIQQMGFTSTANAQQLARFVAEVAQDPSLIKKFNDAVEKRLKAARKLTTDESSTEWEEFRRQYRLARTRAQEDFDKSMKRAQQDFKLGMSRQAEDFHRMMQRQAHDYQTTMSRQEEAYNLTMQRSAEDLARASETIDGNFEKILTQATERLSGHAQKQAKVVLQEFRDLKNATEPEAIDLMTRLAAIFGVKYTPPKGGRRDESGSGPGPQPAGMAAGGVLPGYTPGKDVHTFTSPTGGQLNLSGGEAVMVPEWVRAIGGEKVVHAMNKAARRGYWMGGVLPLFGARVDRHESGYPYPAFDLNVGSGYDDYGMPVHAWKAGTVAQRNYIGDQSYGRWVVVNHGGGQNTLYAHLSRFGGFGVGDKIPAGGVLGYVGDIGNTGTPPTSHLHFEIRGGQVVLSDGSGTNIPVDKQSLKGLFGMHERSEAAAAAMSSVHPLGKGAISKIINTMARDRLKQLRQHRAATTTPGVGNIPPEPGTNLDNQALVRRAANQRGWGEQWPSLYQLVMHESGFRSNAQNPTSSAYGMFQFLDGTWDSVGGHKTSDPWLQAVYGMRYIAQRYGNPNKAWDFWQGHHWYKDGSVFSGAQTIGVGEHGPEMVLPLNERGADFIGSLISKYNTGNTGLFGNVLSRVPMSGGGGSIVSYRIDRSTTFTGDITVQANNPGEMISQLKAQQRRNALAQAGLGGQR